MFLRSMAMMPVNRMVDETPVTAAGLDPESAWWLGVLAETGPRREAALARLHELLVRIARAEVARRGPRLRITGPELDDLACQAAADALMAITGKLGQFRGESRFTTWACKFAIFEVSAKIGRHFWRHPALPLDAEDCGRLTMDDFLRTDPRDVGCAQAMEMLHVYVELVAAGGPAEQRYPGIAAHLRACGPCGEDFEGLLAAVRGEAD